MQLDSKMMPLLAILFKTLLSLPQCFIAIALLLKKLKDTKIIIGILITKKIRLAHPSYCNWHSHLICLIFSSWALSHEASLPYI